jgi:RNA polymerase sigma-70 factor (ECF subfamily)
MEPDPGRRFTAIFHEHQAQVYGYAVSHAGRQLADDVVGDTFLVAWRRLESVPPDPLPWLLGVARNVIRERYRDEVRQVSLAVELRAWTDDAAADVADGVAERAAMLTALAGLRDEDRELLTLIAWQGLTPRQAAQVVGCSVPTYFVRLHRARKRLQEALSSPVPIVSAAPSCEEFSR